MNSNELTKVGPATLAGALRVCVTERVPAFIWGSPGIGKSAIVRQVAADLGAHLIDVRASQWDAVDTRGVPYVEAGGGDEGRRVTRWAVPSVFPSADEAARHPLVMIFLDELNSGAGSVQAALYQLVLDRRLGDYVLPDNVVVLAAGNLETDRAVTHRMSTALAGRFGHLELLVDSAAWERWALGAGVHTAVLAFLRYRPALLHAWDARSASKAQPTPRTWEMASRLVSGCERSGAGRAVETALLAGCVGEGAGAELAGFLEVYRSLPDPAAILMDPDRAPIPEEPATVWALCGALAERASTANAANLFRYATRLRDARTAGPEFMTLLVRLAATRRPEVQSTRAFIEWAAANADVLL